jgi:hypothetical protein
MTQIGRLRKQPARNASFSVRGSSDFLEEVSIKRTKDFEMWRRETSPTKIPTSMPVH